MIASQAQQAQIRRVRGGVSMGGKAKVEGSAPKVNQGVLCGGQGHAAFYLHLYINISSSFSLSLL